MKFTDLLWQSIQPIYQDILELAFIQELQQGRLAQNTFNYYLQQDALYLADFARALAIAGTKAPDSSAFLQCIIFASQTITAEMSLHRQFFEKFNIIPQQEKSLSCLAYTRFLLATASLDSFAETMAALLPCFWIYREVGHHLERNTVAANPYQSWIDSYAEPIFNAQVEKIISMTNKAAEGDPIVP